MNGKMSYSPFAHKLVTSSMYVKPVPLAVAWVSSRPESRTPDGLYIPDAECQPRPRVIDLKMITVTNCTYQDLFSHQRQVRGDTRRFICAKKPSRCRRLQKSLGMNMRR